jgi:hypothetical protein
MKRHTKRGRTAALGICAAFTIGLAHGELAATGQDRSDDPGGQVTVTGCLIEFSTANNPAGATDESGLTGATNPNSASEIPPRTAGEQFVLTLTSAPPATTVAPPSSQTSDTAGTATRYLVIGLQTDDLRKHVMRLVEMSGTLEPNHSAASDRPRRGLEMLPRLSASSVRTVAGSCSPAGSQE